MVNDKQLTATPGSFLAAAGQSCPPEGVQYFADSSQCDRYTECREGVATEQLCPDGLLFNDKVTDGRYPCFYEPEVDCGTRTQRRKCAGDTQLRASVCGLKYSWFRIFKL